MVTKGSVKSSVSRAKAPSSVGRTASISSSSSWSTVSSQPQAKKTSEGFSKNTGSFWGASSSSSGSHESKKESSSWTKSSDTSSGKDGGIFSEILALFDRIYTVKGKENSLAKSSADQSAKSNADFKIIKKNSDQSILKDQAIKKNKDELSQELNLSNSENGFTENRLNLIVNPDFLINTEEKAVALDTLGQNSFQEEPQKKRNWLLWLLGTLFISALLARGLEVILPDLIYEVKPSVLSTIIWISFSLYWPFKREKGAILAGCIVILIGFLSGNLIGGIGIGALIAGMLHMLIGKRFIISIAVFGLMMFACLNLNYFAFTYRASVLQTTPEWFFTVTMAVAVLGFFWEKVKVQLMSRYALSAKTDNMQGVEKVDSLDTLSAKNKVRTNGQNSEYEPYYADLRVISVICENLPDDLLLPTEKIGQKTLAILECMNEDERDVQTGHQFLGRYLPMIRKSLETFSRLAKHKVNEEEFLKAKLLTQQVLNNMAAAFTQMHQQLLSNDVDDLVVNLKTLDRLRQSAGFDIAGG